MPKNSRPDIQVLEDRIVRLKAQLLEYQNVRLYGVTKRRLSTVSSELEECIAIIHAIVDADTNNISASSLSAIDDSGLSIPEFSSDSDLLDTFLPNSFGEDSSTSGYSAKAIVSTYSSRIRECAETEGCLTGLIQVNQFWSLLNTWYQNRFTPSKRNPDFHFKANRIHEWIDLLILAAGRALHEGQFSTFVSEMKSWCDDLNTPKDDTWVLPHSVLQLKKLGSECFNKEAVLLELMVKRFLYDNSFYPEEKHSIRKIVIENTEFSKEDLTLKAILESGCRVVRTSSLDISKYQEEE